MNENSRVHQNRSEQNKTKNKKADKKNQEKNGPQKESGKKSARSKVEHVSSEEDKETTGDVGNDSGKTVTSDGRESDHNGKFNECSEQDDTNKSVGVGDRDKNEDILSEEDQETSGDVGNDSGKTVTSDGRESDRDGKVNEPSEQDDISNSVGVGNHDNNQDVSSEQDQETSGDVGNDSRKTFTGDGRESDHDGKVNEHSEQDDTNNSVGVSNPDKNLDVSSEEYKKTTGEVGNYSRKTVTIDGRESDHDGKVNECSEQDDTNKSVGVSNCDKNQDFSSEEDKQTTGDVGNDSGKTVTSDGRESDRDGKVNEPSEQDDISNSVGVGNHDNNQDVSSEQDQETSGDVGNDSRKTVTGDGRESDHDGKVNEHSVHDDTYNSVGVDNRDKNQDISLEEDKNTSGNVKNDSGKTVTGYGRESDHDGKVNEPSVQDDTSKSVGAGNHDKNEDNSSEEDKKTSGIVGNDSGKTVTIDGRKSDHDGKFNEHSVHDDKNNSVGVDNRDKNQEENGPQKSRIEDVSSEEDKETSGDVGNDSGKIVMIDGRESDHDGKVSERSVKDDTNNSVDVGNRDKNQEENGPQKSGIDVTSEEDKETSGNVGNNEKEVLQSDFDSSDDDNVPLSTFKMSSSVSHESTACFTDIDADNARDDAAYDGSTFGIEGIIERLTDNEYKDESDYRMSMEEYRLTYAQDFLKGGVFDEGTIIKETRHEVDREIFSQSDTTVTTVTGESPNISSDSEPEIVIHRKKVSKKKKKRFIMKKRII